MYANIIYVLLNLQASPELSTTKSMFLKMKSLKFCIIDNSLFWRNHEGILINYLLKEEFDNVLQEFHAGDFEDIFTRKPLLTKFLESISIGLLFF